MIEGINIYWENDNYMMIIRELWPGPLSCWFAMDAAINIVPP